MQDRDPLEDTQRIELPCAYCGAAAKPIATSEPPPLRALSDRYCMQSTYPGMDGKPRWQWCSNPGVREFRATVVKSEP